MELLSTTPEDIRRAGALLRQGALVAFPTETVYGLGGRADDADAVARIFAAKGRPPNHPVIVHVGDAEALDRWAREVPESARRLAEELWPGPLTMILRCADSVSRLVTGGQSTVGLRMPNHPIALALLTEVGTGLAAPSANRFGHVSPTTARHVIEELGDRVAAIVDGGPCQVGLESTIVDLSGEEPRVLRPGAITEERLMATLGRPLQRSGTNAPRAPGTLRTHYAPSTPVEVLPADDLDARVQAQRSEGRTLAVLAFGPPRGDSLGGRWRAMPEDAAEYARALYATLRDVDRPDCDVILVERPPQGLDWVAVHDRLSRASAKS